MTRAAVPDDVRRALAHGPGEHGLDARVERDGSRMDVGLDAGGGQGHAGAGQLTLEGWLVVAADRLAHLAERFARDLLELGDLTGGGVGPRIEEATGELGLERDDRQGVAQQVVQITGEALALLR